MSKFSVRYSNCIEFRLPQLSFPAYDNISNSTRNAVLKIYDGVQKIMKACGPLLEGDMWPFLDQLCFRNNLKVVWQR